MAKPVFKQYREKDGKFYFKLVDTSERVLLQSPGFANPKDAGASMAQLRKVGVVAWCAALPGWQMPAQVSPDDAQSALQLLCDAS